MNKNMGATDRIIRGTVAVLLVILYATGLVTDGWRIAVLALAVIMLLTAVIGLCPIYSLLGVNTCKTPKY